MSDDFFPTSEHDQSELDSSGMVDKEGWYHFEVLDVTPELDEMDTDGKSRTPCYVLKCVVIHEVPGQSEPGKMLYHRIYVGSSGGGTPKPGVVKNAIRFMTGIGTMRWQELDGKNVAVDISTGRPAVGKATFAACKGRQFIAQIKKEEGGEKYKDKYVIPFSEVYLPGDPKVASVPYNKSAWSGGSSSGDAAGLDSLPSDF